LIFDFTNFAVKKPKAWSC